MASNGSGINKARLTTGVVVIAAGLAVGLSIFAVNRSSVQPTEVAAAVATSSQVQSSEAPSVTTEAPTTEAPTTEPPTATSAPATSAPETSAMATTAAPTSVPQAQAAAPAAPAATATYTVQPGDNLTVIAAWFKLNGYGDLYEANKAVLGANPNLIHPGQVISLTVNGVSVAPAPR